MACSVCREKSHDKRQCPTAKENRREALKIQRERLNMVIQVAPALLANPIAQAFLWFYISDRVPLLDSLNKVIVGTQVLSAIPTVDINAFPKGVILGAFMQETKDLKEYKDKIIKAAKKAASGAAGGAGAGRAFSELDAGSALSDFFGWLGGGVETVKEEFKEGTEGAGFGAGGIGN